MGMSVAGVLLRWGGGTWRVVSSCHVRHIDLEVKPGSILSLVLLMSHGKPALKTSGDGWVVFFLCVQQ